MVPPSGSVAVVSGNPILGVCRDDTRPRTPSRPPSLRLYRNACPQAVQDLTDRQSWRGGLRVTLASGMSLDKATAKLKAAQGKKARQDRCRVFSRRACLHLALGLSPSLCVCVSRVLNVVLYELARIDGHWDRCPRDDPIGGWSSILLY